MTLNTPTRGEQLALVVFLCAAIAAYGSSFQQPAIWIFWLPAVLSVFWRIGHVAEPVRKYAKYATWTLAAVAVALGLILMAYAALISDAAAKWLTLVTGYGLALMASVFVLGTPVWSIAEGFFPAAAGLLAVAAFNPTAKITPLLVAPGVAMFVYLLLTKRPPKLARLVSAQLVITLLASVLLASAFFTTIPQLQRQIEMATLRWLSGQPSTGNPTAMQSQVGDLEELQLSKRVVMRVWTREPQKLRGRIFGRFNGRGWQAHVTPSKPLVPAASARPWLSEVPGTLFALPATRADNGVETRILQSATNPGVLLTPPNMQLARVPLSSVSADAFGILTVPLLAEVNMYGVVTRPEGETAAQPDADFLELPANLDPRWKEVAQRLSDGSSSPQERIERTVEYVKHAATYSLKVGAFRTKDPVAEFFFEKKRGYCQYFASSAVLLLRLQGVPARYVTGYTVQEYNERGGYYVVRDADAHAWMEVFDGRRWREADPTPEAEFDARRQAGDIGWLAQSVEWAAALASETWQRARSGDWRGALASVALMIKALARAVVGSAWALVVLVVLSVAIVWRIWKRRERFSSIKPKPADSIAAPMKDVLDALDLHWTRAGYERPRSRGLLEHVAMIPEQPAGEFRNVSRKLVDVYYRGSFGECEISPAERRQADELASLLAAETQKLKTAAR